MTWKQFVYQNVVDCCNKAGTRTFSMQEFFDDRRTAFMQFGQSNKYIRQKIRQQLQFLRDAKVEGEFNKMIEGAVKGNG